MRARRIRIRGIVGEAVSDTILPPADDYVRKYGGANGYGHILNEAATAALPRYAHFAALHLAADQGDPPACSIRIAQKVFDQGPTSACTGHAIARALNTAFELAGLPLPFVVSPMCIYTPARCLDRASFIVSAVDEPLGDDGADAQKCSTAVSLFGVCAIGTPTPMASDGRYSDADPETVNREPDFKALLKAAKAIVVGQHGVVGVNEARHSIASRIPVTVAIYVDRRVEAYKRGDAPLGAPDKTDRSGGWHYVLIDGYRTEADGSTTFLWANSWGSALWGDAGFGEGNEAWFNAARDVIAWVPRKVA